MARKMTGETEAAKEKILRKLDEPNYQKPLKVEGGLLVDVEEDDYGKYKSSVLFCLFTYKNHLQLLYDHHSNILS